ncbi:MAG: hypothetical protein OHK006_00820 [Thermodesulfovibrionales bacterium]
MALFNYATKEITLKIVYYGPGLSGKTTNLQQIHSVLSPSTKGKLLSLSTEADRTLFFDFLPVELGKIRDFSIRFQLYTVPGQVRYNATRKVVLKGADAVVFVADSQQAMRDQNIESLENMKDNLRSNNINPDSIPILLQYNKRDLPNIMTVEEMNADLNKDGAYEFTESTAVTGTGVEETFRQITKLLLKDIAKKHRIEVQENGDQTEPRKPAAAGPEPAAVARPLFDVPMSLPPLPEAAEEEIPTLEEEAIEVLEEEDDAVEAVGLAEEEDLPAAAAEAGTAEPQLPRPAEEPEREPEPEPAPEKLMLRPQESIFPEPEKEHPQQVEKRPEPEKSTRPSFRQSIAESLPKQKPEKLPLSRPLFEQPDLKKEAPAAPRTAFPVQPVSSIDSVRADKLATELVRVAASLEKTGLVVAEIRNSLASLKSDISLIKAELGSLKSEIASRKATDAEQAPAAPAVDPKAIKAIMREQAEIISSIREIGQLLNTLQEKKSWFRF